MRFAALLAGLCALPLPALADACSEEIAALFRGGALDPFARPNRREVTVSVAPDGSETPRSDVLWDGPLRAINCANGMCLMQVEREMWMGPGRDGPWAATPSQLPDDPAAFARKIADDMAANLTDTECLGPQPFEGGTARVYRYRTRTEANEFGSWWGGLFTAWIDAEGGLLMRLEETETVASWAAGPDPAVLITTVTYDPGIAITPPAE